MCFVVRNEMPTFAAESVRAFTTFEHTFFAFAIISRLAKSLGNSIGIKSTRIICEGLLRIWCALNSCLAMLTLKAWCILIGVPGFHSEAAPC